MADFDSLLDSMEDVGAFSPAQRNLCAGLLAKFEPTPDVGATMFSDAVPPEVGAIHEAIEKDHRAYYLSHKDLDKLPPGTRFVAENPTSLPAYIRWQMSPEVAKTDQREFDDLLLASASDGTGIVEQMQRLFKLTEHYEAAFIRHAFAEKTEDRPHPAAVVVGTDFTAIEARVLAHATGVGGKVLCMDTETRGFPNWPRDEPRGRVLVYDEFFHFANQPRYDLPPAEDDGADKRRKQAKLTYKDRAADSRDAKEAMRERALAKLAKRKKN